MLIMLLLTLTLSIVLERRSQQRNATSASTKEATEKPNAMVVAVANEEVFEVFEVVQSKALKHSLSLRVVGSRLC
jgi:hypothetical protein